MSPFHTIPHQYMELRRVPEHNQHKPTLIPPMSPFDTIPHHYVELRRVPEHTQHKTHSNSE